MTLPREIEGWAAEKSKQPLVKTKAPLPGMGEYGVVLELRGCGVCHSDIHLIDDDWMISQFPLVPGHEILGTVVAKGSAVNTLELGSWVGVGWQHSSCLNCGACLTSRENLCDYKQATCVERWGGFANYHLADSRFCFELPPAIAKPEFSPLLCGGITVFSPLCEFLSQHATHHARIGIVGLGGLGHLAVKFAAALGHEVAVFSTSLAKTKEAKLWGAQHFLSSTESAQIKKMGSWFDLIIVTVNADLPWQLYVESLREDGTLCFVGIPPSPLQIHPVQLLAKRLRLVGSPIGGRARMRQMLELVAQRQISPQVETYPLEKVNEVITRLRENRVRYRAVLTP